MVEPEKNEMENGAEEMSLSKEEDDELEAYWAMRDKQEAQATPADRLTSLLDQFVAENKEPPSEEALARRGSDVQDVRFIECVAERDVDLPFLEELHVSASFRSWLLAEVFGPDVGRGNFLGHGIP